ncbi:hypothetical protein [Wocania ichthyoenteri]|uniref:hypothetical protein n=1 Tax=Wocania ichthyoenteri TaxID=1230531 RepID=UPI00053E0487|nr:hypothetical protein [Wocania ichthyoenteri]
MKPYLYLLIVLIFTACSKNSVDKNCNFLLDVGVNISINMSLPQYSQLAFVSNPVYIPNAGNGGIYVTNTGTGFVAFDAADPNHIPSSCSKLTLSGINGICGCDDENEYSLFNGLPVNNSSLRCPLKAYRVEENGTTLLIFN